MSLGQNKAVPVLFLRVIRIDVHLFEVKICHDICDGKRAAGMSGFRCMNCGHNAFSYFIGCFFQFQFVHTSSPVFFTA